MFANPSHENARVYTKKHAHQYAAESNEEPGSVILPIDHRKQLLTNRCSRGSVRLEKNVYKDELESYHSKV